MTNYVQAPKGERLLAFIKFNCLCSVAYYRLGIQFLFMFHDLVFCVVEQQEGKCFHPSAKCKYHRHRVESHSGKSRSLFNHISHPKQTLISSSSAFMCRRFSGISILCASEDEEKFNPIWSSARSRICYNFPWHFIIIVVSFASLSRPSSAAAANQPEIVTRGTRLSILNIRNEH